MLARIPSYELTEWKAYERAFGPLGQFYETDVMAAMHEQLQHIAALLTQDGKGSVEHIPRPMEVWKTVLDRQEAEDKVEEMSDEESNAAAVAAMNLMFE
jgi:hypothetical protein